jgi:broad specificity polyphosphatase/5'/3'-nucleotidase SurE
MIILISNDDGIQSEGIIALEEALRPVVRFSRSHPIARRVP